MSTRFGEFLQYYMATNKLTLEYIARHTGASVSIVGHYRKGIRTPKDDFLERFFAKFIRDEKEQQRIRYLVAYDRSPALAQESLNRISKFNSRPRKMPILARASAGLGYLNFDAPERYQSMDLSYLGVNEENLFLVEVSGNSMYPTLFDADILIVDSSQTNINQIKGKICVLVYNDQTYVKRVETDKNQIRLVSDNSDKDTYPDIIVDGNDLENLVCKGVVLECRRGL